jgi:hypothetical protein
LGLLKLLSINKAIKSDNSMATNIRDIIDNVKQVYLTDSALQTLMDFERVLDELDLYAFQNWKKGELVKGPDYERYFVTCTFMWPKKMMPDPDGGVRLLDYGCEIRYIRESLEYPVKVEGPDDFEPGTKMNKMATKPVWLVEIVMPKKLMQDITKGSIELEGDTIDAEDIEHAYETGADEDVYQSPTEDGANGGAPAPAAPAAAPAEGAPA